MTLKRVAKEFRVWDVVALTLGGEAQAVHISPLDSGEYQAHPGKFLMRARRNIRPILQSELNVRFRDPFTFFGESIGQLMFVVFPEGARPPDLLGPGGVAARHARLADLYLWRLLDSRWSAGVRRYSPAIAR